MKRQTIQRKFKNTDKTDIKQLVHTVCEIIRQHHEKHGVDITQDYYQYGLAVKLNNDILNRQYPEKPYNLAVDYVEDCINAMEAQL